MATEQDDSSILEKDFEFLADILKESDHEIEEDLIDIINVCF